MKANPIPGSERGRSTQLSLELSPDEKPYWKVSIQDKENTRSYHNWSGDVTANDFGLPALRTLSNFPNWLREIAGPLQTAFDYDQAIFDTGRHVKFKKELRAWLDG